MEQFTLFDFTRRPFKISNKVRLIELFGGIGSQSMALERLGVDFEHYRLVEFDKFPVASYNAIHGTDFEPTDITKIHGKDLGIIDTDLFTYLLTYSFPCQDLSVAGKMKGMTKGSGTRSGLLWEVERLLNEVENLPQVLLMENVPQVHSKDNMPDFQNWISFLESKGYVNYWQDLNAKEYGVAQNRDRCFMVSLLGEYNFKFPQTIELTKVMKDYLEPVADEKYYLNSEKAQKLIDKLIADGTLPIEGGYNKQQLTCQQTSQNKGISQIVSKQDMTQELATLKQMEPALLNYNMVEKVGNDCAKTLAVRDYKGFGTGFDVQNGVIEYERKRNKDNRFTEP